MNGFFKWFKSGAKIKRWIFLMLIGIVLVCYGIAKVLVTDEMGFRELAKIIFVFVLGFTFILCSAVNPKIFLPKFIIIPPYNCYTRTTFYILFI